MIYILTLSQVYSYTAPNTGLNLSSDDNKESWCKKVKEGPQLDKPFVEAVGNYTYVIGSIGEYYTSYDIYIAKFDSSGAKVWERTWDGGRYDYIMGYVIDTNNNFYIIGTSGPPPISGSIFLLKYNITGNLLWSQTLDPIGVNKYEIRSIQTDLNDSIYISSIVGDYPNSTVILTKLNPSGNVIWTHKLEVGDYFGQLVVQIDSIGNQYLFIDYWDLNSTLIKINSSGSLLWEYHLGKYEEAYQMKLDYEDNIILTSVKSFGYTQIELYLRKINSSGNLIKEIILENEGNNYGTWFLDNIFLLVGSSLFEYTYSLNCIMNVTFGNSTKLEYFDYSIFFKSSDQKMYLLNYLYFKMMTILEFNRSGTVLSHFNLGESYYIQSFDAKIGSYDNLYLVCSIRYINIWRESTILTFLVKNPKNDAIAIYLDQNLEPGEIFLFSFLGISILLSFILVFLTLKPKFKNFNRKRLPVKA